MVEIQLTGIEVGTSAEKSKRTFGYRVNDEAKKTVMVVVDQFTAHDLIAQTEYAREFPIIKVDDKRWCFCIDSGDIKMLHHKKGEPA